MDGKPVERGERVDVKGVRLMLSVLSRAAAREVNRGEWFDARWDHEYLSDRPHETVTVPLRRLLVEVGRGGIGGLVEAHARAANIRATIIGEPSLGEVAILALGIREKSGVARWRISERATQLEVKVDRTFAAIAHPHADATDDVLNPPSFSYDTRVMASFTCRYSPLVYLRLLAWSDDLTAAPARWRPSRRRGGDVTLEIPVLEMQAALGASGIVSPSATAQQLILPVTEDLRRVGIDFSWEWEKSPQMKSVKALRLRFSDPGAARAPKRTRTPTAMRLSRLPRPALTGLRTLRPSLPSR
jgi:hypothetical protein